MTIKTYKLIYRNGIKTLEVVKEFECNLEYEKIEKDMSADEMDKLIAQLVDILNLHFDLGYMVEEYYYIVAFNKYDEVVGIFEVSHGIDDSCHATPKEIVTRLLLVDAKKWIGFHNHPSQNRKLPLISKIDEENYEYLSKICDEFGIECINDVVVTGGLFNYYTSDVDDQDDDSFTGWIKDY